MGNHGKGAVPQRSKCLVCDLDCPLSGRQGKDAAFQNQWEGLWREMMCTHPQELATSQPSNASLRNLDLARAGWCWLVTGTAVGWR